ncbi:pre-mRNA-splicing factor 18 isoform 2 [Tropilaelaps mercedesae]|uniref:Pre-mRNA-splicing factor 18 n=1 Tax=Tropilaelaps mercedesae TaxID=418985 RepID=A0A1V9XTB5_9ACAR|nr:pre-mRNA-splicing factor 18 isoform 2 [Tropilaelaps mercedesae]
MDVLKAEIERKRRVMQDKQLVGPDKKYFKRGDLIKKEQDEYISKLLDKQTYKAEDDPVGPSRVVVVREKAGSSKGKTEQILPRKEVMKRLRDRNQPILLFGESETEAFRRLRRLEVQEPELEKGFRNDFQEALEKVDQVYLQELLKDGDASRKDNRSRHDVATKDEGTSEQDMLDIGTRLGSPENKARDPHDVLKVLKYLQFLWGAQLNARPLEEKASMKGKLVSATYSQTDAYLAPLFKLLGRRTIPEDILEHLVIIVRHLIERNYVAANDAYLQMAIGNAPWPIGVTMVGIHARTGREKIFAQNIAHVLNDETQRKYIQGLKRLMTQCQRMFPTDPSRCVEYNA